MRGMANTHLHLAMHMHPKAKLRHLYSIKYDFVSIPRHTILYLIILLQLSFSNSE